MRVVVSLTTIPGREAMLSRAVASIIRQTRPPDAIHLWLPEERFGSAAALPSFPGVVVRAGPDLGPAMKLLPTLEVEADPETLLIPVDDDIEYPPELIEKLVAASMLLPEHAIGFTGWSCEERADGPRIRHWNEQEPFAGMLQPVQVLEGYRGVLYRRRFFESDIRAHLDALEAFRYHDDILFSGYLASRGVARVAQWFGSVPRSADTLWLLHGDDTGLHTLPDWYARGRECLAYWAQRAPGFMAAVAGSVAGSRLQLETGEHPRVAFLHHASSAVDFPIESAHDLFVMPWPWSEGLFSEVLLVRPDRLAALPQERWLAECRRILEPGGVLRVFWPALPVSGQAAIPRGERMRSDAGAGATAARFRGLAVDRGWQASWTTDRDGVTATLIAPCRGSQGSRHAGLSWVATR
ncbi:glycosyltransferase family A protein [Thiocapsa marina]|uniref:Glycosyltransferase 2-like domain-containing protein n=1 Tax=Thiocapsa marina 5811 TaxID=768671 RepID=F9U9C4_9GAMM|nr:glycosyltransferase family A protein [Thiocapsa marina]EGV19382.1 hypothetical protein ThimaDRAFT_1526 [Thiocapsa marina 5811]